MSGEPNELERLRAENTELRAKVWLLELDISKIGPENVKLYNAHNAALAEIARLKSPKQKGKRGRPSKKATGTCEEYLVRTAMEEIVKSMRNGGKRITEREAAVIADGLLRKTAANLQQAGIPGAFAGYAANYPADENSIYNAFRRGKRAMGFVKSQTKKS
jgi:hypothetical protein